MNPLRALKTPCVVFLPIVFLSYFPGRSTPDGMPGCLRCEIIGFLPLSLYLFTTYIQVILLPNQQSQPNSNYLLPDHPLLQSQMGSDQCLSQHEENCRMWWLKVQVTPEGTGSEPVGPTLISIKLIFCGIRAVHRLWVFKFRATHPRNISDHPADCGFTKPPRSSVLFIRFCIEYSADQKKYLCTTSDLPALILQHHLHFLA